MRFAGQRFRAPKQRSGRFVAEDGSAGRAAYRPQIQGLAPSRASMPEQTASRFTKTGEPDFVIKQFVEPDFNISI